MLSVFLLRSSKKRETIYEFMLLNGCNVWSKKYHIYNIYILGGNNGVTPHSKKNKKNVDILYIFAATMFT